MFKKLHYKVRGLPTPLAGLALGIASLGWCLENALPLAGWGQTTGAVIGLVMIGFLVLRFTAHHDTLWADLKHPVVQPHFIILGSRHQSAPFDKGAGDTQMTIF